MRAIDAYLQQMDHAWEHRWESLRAALKGVTEEEAAWQAPCYAKEEPEAGWPLPGTIRWQVAHVAHCKRYYADVIRARAGEAALPTPVRAPTRTLAEDLAELEAAHADERGAAAACMDADLGVLLANKMPLAEFLGMVTRHAAWHASQIAVARRLWRTRG